MTESIFATDLDLYDGPGLAELADKLKALSDPTRLRIVQLLTQTSAGMTPTDMATDQGLSTLKQPTVSHHLTRLRTAGLVTASKTGVNVTYAADLDALAELGALLNVPAPAPAAPKKPRKSRA